MDAARQTVESDTFSEYRALLFSIAYRMLGSVMDAEDAVQETFLRWQKAPEDEIRSPKSYLSTVVTRLCIDQLRSARSQRERYIGPWLPEPLIVEQEPAAEASAALADSLSLAFLVLLENLSPAERAVFLLRDVFEYGYPEIAQVVDKSESNCRQTLHRARQKLAERPRRFEATSGQIASLMERFQAAAVGGDMEGLLDLLTDDVTVWSDGGGKVPAALNPVYGASDVARLFIGLTRDLPSTFTTKAATVNGQPGVINYVGGAPHSVIAADLDGDKISAFRIIVNPEKLRRVPLLED